MVMTTSKPISPRLADMNREDAEEVTRLIKENFDSLGDMLLQARDRKAYKALGYRSFESYCQSEFGKSISSAYQLIEDAKVISQLEARISEEYGEDVTLKFPSSHLKPLKAIDNIDDKLKAIEYAQKLAAAENRKATKKDLEIAVFQVSGKRSEDFREAIESLGFQRGVQVEVLKSLNKDRGFVTKVDKGGQIYVELHYGGVVPIPYDAADLRILSEEEQPAKPLNENITNKGDRVLIFSPALKGKEGTIFQWKPGKQALVMVDGQNSPVDIAYAEMQLLLKPEKKDSGWETDLSWSTTKQTYYYFQKEDKIYSDKWPAGLTLTPSSYELSPIEFIENWEQTFAEQLLQLFPQAIPESPSALVEENRRLREQLTEAEAAIKAMIASSKPSVPTDYLLENYSQANSAERIDSWKQILETKHFIPIPYRLDGLFKGSWRGWKFFFHTPNGGLTTIDLANDKKEMFTRCTEGDEDETIQWVKGLINQIEDFSPGQLSLNLQPVKNITSSVEIAAELPPDISSQIPSIRNKLFSLIEKYEQSKRFASKRKEIENLDGNIKTVQERLRELEKFEHLRIGHTICHQRRPMILGKIIGFDFSQGEMPIVWVKYFKEGELEKTPTSELVSMIFIVEI